MVVERGVEERGEGTDYRHAEGILPRDKVARKDSPRALRVADATAARVAVNCDRKLYATVEHFRSKRLRQQNAAGPAVRTRPRSIRHVCPAFQKHKAAAIFLNNIQAAFKANEITPWFAAFVALSFAPGLLNERFCACARPGH